MPLITCIEGCKAVSPSKITICSVTPRSLGRHSWGQDVAGQRERLARAEGELATAYQEGRTLPFREVAALVLRLLEEFAQALLQPDAAPSGARRTAPLAQRPDWSLLTARKQEVLRLVAQGLSSKTIGQQVFLAPSTVNHHLTAIFNKLGANTHAQAVAEAVQRGLL